MRQLSAPTQHAFLLKKVDSVLSRRLSLSTTETTPIFPHGGGLSYFDIIDKYLQEMCPVLIRRQEFFAGRQNEGEDNSQIRDRLRSLADDGDIIGMHFEDIMCFQYIQGVRDNDLRKDLSSVKNPDLVKFNLLLVADMQAKITVRNMTHGISSFHTPSQSKKGAVRNQHPTSALSEEEK